MKSDEHYMRLALKQAEKAAVIGEVPIGCVIVCDGVIVGRGYNKIIIGKFLLIVQFSFIKKTENPTKDSRFLMFYD